MSQAIAADVLEELAPSGKIRFAINLANPVLAQGDAADPKGVTIDLSRKLAEVCGVTAELFVFDSAGKVVDALKSGDCDVAYMAVDPARAEDFAFSPAYMLIEGAYAVRADSDLRTPLDVDRAGIRVASTSGTAYTKHLARSLKSAELIEVADGFASFREGSAEAVAGIRQPVAKFAANNPDARMLDERFMEIPQALAVARGRTRALVFLREFIEEAKTSGFVADSLRASGHGDAVIAPSEA